MKHVRYVATAVAVLFAGGAWAAGTTQNSHAEDKQITKQVQSELQQQDVASTGPIRVMTRNGVVELNGTVQNEAARQKAAQAARNVPGVESVQDNLTVAIR